MQENEKVEGAVAHHAPGAPDSLCLQGRFGCPHLHHRIQGR
ncbi:hypothetical protein [Streptomyces sioyaensis]